MGSDARVSAANGMVEVPESPDTGQAGIVRHAVAQGLLDVGQPSFAANPDAGFPGRWGSLTGYLGNVRPSKAGRAAKPASGRPM